MFKLHSKYFLLNVDIYSIKLKGGFYDENMEYNPGESWDEENACYHSNSEDKEEDEFKQFRYGAIFDEEEKENDEDGNI